jgi:hypothetical protein
VSAGAVGAGERRPALLRDGLQSVEVTPPGPRAFDDQLQAGGRPGHGTAPAVVSPRGRARQVRADPSLPPKVSVITYSAAKQ